MKSVHPFEGQKFDHARSLKFWDDYAYDYEGCRIQGDIPKQISERLFELGYLKENAIEFGCGPGTYSVHLAKYLKKLTCVDYSERMLALLLKSCSEAGIDNVTTQSADFTSMSGNKQYSLAIAPLCPGAGTEEGLRIMESFATDACVHVTWIGNNWDDLHMGIWKELGRNYSYESRNTDSVSPILKEMGRDMELEEFSTVVERTFPMDKLIEREERVFSLYGLEGEDIKGAVEKIFGDYVTDGVFSMKCESRIRMIRWAPGGKDAC